MTSSAPEKTGLIETIKKVPPISGFVRAHNLGRGVIASKSNVIKNVGLTVAGFIAGGVTAVFGLQVGAVGALLLAATPGIANGIPGLAVVTLAGGVACASVGTWVCSFSSGLIAQSADNFGSGFVNTGKAVGKAAGQGVKAAEQSVRNSVAARKKKPGAQTAPTTKSAPVAKAETEKRESIVTLDEFNSVSDGHVRRQGEQQVGMPVAKNKKPGLG